MPTETLARSKISGYASLVELLTERGEQRADKLAFRFLRGGEGPEYTQTFAETQRQARSIAALLQQYTFPGSRALLLYQPGLDYINAFFGCLYAGVIAVPTYPPRGNRRDERIHAIIADAGAEIVLSTEQILRQLAEKAEEQDWIHRLRCLATDGLPEELADTWMEVQPGVTDLAFLQYTSGSTGQPKGVMVSHGNLLHNITLIRDRLLVENFESHHIISWLPPYHDMGLIGCILQPVLSGCPMTLMPPTAFLMQPYRWLKIISDYRGTDSVAPNFAYELCLHRITVEQRDSLDLGSWRVALNGSEPVRADTLRRFAEFFRPCGFRPEAFGPAYGLAEATLMVSGLPPADSYTVYPARREALAGQRLERADPDETAIEELVGSGPLTEETEVRIVNPETLRVCEPDRIGEVWVRGPSVAQGYWDKPQLSRETFQAHLSGDGEGPFLRTGDLGFLYRGELFITGRLKDLIIIRGRNHYPQDIEQTVENCHPALRVGCSAAFSVEINGEEKLVVTAEIERRYRLERREPVEDDSPEAREERRRLAERRREAVLPNIHHNAGEGGPLVLENVIQDIRQAVAEKHQLQVYAVVLLRVGSIPKTSSGKIQRHACKTGFLNYNLNVVSSSILEQDQLSEVGEEIPLNKEILLGYPATSRRLLVGNYLQNLLARLLKVPVSQLDQQQTLGSLGLDSLLAVELQLALETDFQVTLPMSRLLEGLSIAQAANEILEQIDTNPTLQPLTHLEVEEAPQSHNQQALWFLHQLAPRSAAYNIFFAVRITSALDIPALRRALEFLQARHPALRTVYRTHNNLPYQRILERTDIDFELLEAEEWSRSRVEKFLSREGHRPFDLENGPIWRTRLLVQGEHEHILFMSLHHICTDLWSMQVMMEELGLCYMACRQDRPMPLEPLEFSYTDYVRWQQQLLAVEGEQLWDYWRRQLAGELPVLNLPLDWPRPPGQSFVGTSHAFALDSRLSQTLKKLAKARGVTLNTLLLTIFQVLLHRYSGQQDILVGTPTAGREHPGFQYLFGYFVNLIVLRGDLSGNPTFVEFLEQLRRVTLGALAHQAYPFQSLVERLQPERDPGLPPLVQVTFGLQKPHRMQESAPFVLKEEGARLSLGDLRVESVGLKQRISQFDLTLMMVDTEQGLLGSLEYSTDLFEPATAARMMAHFRNLAEAVAHNPLARVDELELLDEAERRQLLLEWGGRRGPYSHDRCIHRLFEDWVARAPESPALVFGETVLSYRELDRRANRLAHYLRQLGVGPEVTVAIYLERGFDMIISVLAVFKAGGGYLPLDPAYPWERLRFMLADTEAPILLGHRTLLEGFAPTDCRLLCLEELEEVLAVQPDTPPDCEAGPDNLAYVIYTSGSTGLPKGTQLLHRGLCNMAAAQARIFRVQPEHRILQFASFSFDSSIWEIVWALSAGASLYLGRREDLLPGPTLRELLNAQRITHVAMPPSALALFEPEDLPHLHTIIVAGEACPPQLARRWSQGRYFFNGYGPTESTVCTTLMECQGDEAKPPIGRPIPNVWTYILDAGLEPVPIGVPGELYIAGASLARGYINRPELNAEKFVRLKLDESRPRLYRLSEEEDKNGESFLAYRSGDLARWLPNGNIEFVGRVDHQVKIRGFRIEPGEIESVLRNHAGIQDALVIPREAGSLGEQRLVAYIIPRQTRKTTNEQAEDWQEYLSHWHTLYQETYAIAREQADQTLDFNITGWNSSYTDKPIPPEEMREWVAQITELIVSFQPQRVLEIGCGTGLLLTRLAPRCESYWATDFSAAALDYVEQLKARLPGLENVKLLQRMADDFSGLHPEQFDTVVINSVVQYFPGVEYLRWVLSEAVRRVKPGGRVIIGDVRAFPLLTAYHASVQWHKADPGESVGHLYQSVRRHYAQEEELTVSPEFFAALAGELPGARGVEIHLKRGRSHNELTRFRYEVVLKTGEQAPANPSIPWLDWFAEVGDLEHLRQRLAEEQPVWLGLRRVPNARLKPIMRLLNWLEDRRNEIESLTCGQLRATLETQQTYPALEPEDFHRLAEELGYQARVGWSREAGDGHFDVVFRHESAQEEFPLWREENRRLPWHHYANNPLQGKFTRQLVPLLRQQLQGSLPEYMRPSAYVILDAFPLTPNGKIDRRALPAPDFTRNLPGDYSPPRGPVERLLVEIWAELLGLGQVGIHDNFFELGGHSLLATQVISRIRDALNLEAPVRYLFEAPTIAELSERLETLRWAATSLQEDSRQAAADEERDEGEL